jgi:parvulin-like peptidyl-prolyl isomerase
MARRRGDEEEGVSLFPFLSIIACTIGVLTLLISALSLAQMSGEDVASLEHYERIQRQLKEIQEEIERLKSQADEEALQNARVMDERQRQLAAAQQRLDQLIKQIIELRQLLAQLEQEIKDAQGNAARLEQGAAGKRDELAGLKRKLTELEAELKSQKEQLAQLEKELAQRKKPPEESEVSVLPSGSGKGFDPVFVECSGGSVILHQEKNLPRIRAAELAENELFLKLLTEVAASPKKRVIFLIRDNGLGTYRTARTLADEHAAVHGALPVIGQGRLDLSHFKQPQ